MRTHNTGIVFSVTTKGHEMVAYSFGRDGSDGAIPFAGVIDIGVTLYGTTYVGGTGTKCGGGGCGTCFR